MVELSMIWEEKKKRKTMNRAAKRRFEMRNKTTFGCQDLIIKVQRTRFVSECAFIVSSHQISVFHLFLVLWGAYQYPHIKSPPFLGPANESLSIKYWKKKNLIKRFPQTDRKSFHSWIFQDHFKFPSTY